jgi:hypothetical protein
MADQTISQLNLLAAGSLAATDELPIVDISASETKKIRASTLVEAGISLITNGSIDLIKLDQNSTTKIGTSALADAAITSAKLNDNSSIVSASTSPAANNFTGKGWFRSTDQNLYVYSAGAYQQVVMPTAGIADSAVTTVKIAANAITDAKIQSGGLTASGIASNAVTTIKILDGNVTTDKVADSAITNAKIAPNTIASNRLAAGAVDTAALATSGITSTKFAAGAVDTTALGAAAVTNDKIANTTIAYAKLNLADGDVPGTKITSATISGLQISTGGVLTANIADSAITNAKIASGTIGVGKFANGAIDTVNIADDAVTLAKIADGAVGSAQLVDSGVTAIKLANSSSTVVQANAPVANGAFTGQQFLDTSTGYEYTWNGASWQRQAAINDITFNDSTPLTFSVAYADDFSAQITTGLDNQTANRVFAGPISGSPSTPTFRNLAAADLPLATAGTVGAVLPGAGLQMGSPGTIEHSNSTTAGTFAGAITIDAQGHIVSASPFMSADDVPDLDASKITTGTFSSTFLAPNSVTAAQLADYGIAQVSESAPTPEFAGQWWINPNDRSAYIWVGAVAPSPEGYWLNLGYGSPTQINLRFGGTYNASGNVVQSINSYGIEAGLTIGQPLSSPNTSNNGVYLICTSSGVGTTPAPNENLAIGNWVLSEGVGSTWTKVTLSSAVAGVADQDVLVDGSALIPVASGVASQEDLNEILWARAQIANLTTAGIVRASTEIAVASGTGEMSIGTVDDGSY